MEFGLLEMGAVVRAFASRLEADREALDALNVFPVADNDTGTNMVRSLSFITSALDTSTTLEDAARKVETAALDGRGNSGLIIGQFLAGLFSVVDHDHIELGLGVAEGASWARRAVASPVEGTMLTVADVAAASFSNGCGLDVVVGAVVDAVEATPAQLPILAERGVVDSGAAGLLLFFEALLDVVNGAVGSVVDSVDTAGREDLIGCAVGLGPEPDSMASSYEIQFRVPASLVSGAELQNLLVDVGTDVVVASSADQFAAHLHVEDPHIATAAISSALEARSGAKAISYAIEPITEPGRHA